MNTTKETWRAAEKFSLRYDDGSPCDTIHIRDESGTAAWVPEGFPRKAVLIAAAPELLEALKGFVEYYEAYNPITDKRIEPYCVEARAAIAKAEGK
jgi:hypothetical protein